MNNTAITSVSAESFDVLTARDRSRVAIRVNPHSDAQPFLIPVALPWAKDLGEALLETVYALAPELFAEQMIDNLQ